MCLGLLLFWGSVVGSIGSTGLELFVWGEFAPRFKRVCMRSASACAKVAFRRERTRRAFCFHLSSIAGKNPIPVTPLESHSHFHTCMIETMGLLYTSIAHHKRRSCFRTYLDLGRALAGGGMTREDCVVFAKRRSLGFSLLFVVRYYRYDSLVLVLGTGRRRSWTKSRVPGRRLPVC